MPTPRRPIVLTALLPLLVLLLAAASAAQAAPSALPNGLIAQGPYLFCGDDEGMLHILYRSRPLIHGMGVFCGVNGYTRPSDLQMQDVAREDGSVVYRGQVRGQDLAFEQSASIDGNRVRVRIRRIGEWPGDTWGGFQIPLPTTLYGGARYRAGDDVMTYPADYSPDNRFGRAVRIESNLDVPHLNLVFECEDGLGLSDYRRWGGPRFILSMDVPRGERDTAELFITLPEPADEAPMAAVRWSQIGYPLGGEKFVVLEWPQTEPRPDDAVRLEERGGRIVREGRFGRTLAVDYIQGRYAEFDFSDLAEPGEYRVVWSGGATGWFPVAADVFVDSLWEPTLDCFIPFEMCHAGGYLGNNVTGHPKCHMDDGARVPANYRGPDGFVSHEAEGTPYGPGDHVACALGGWHDAGDYDVNVKAAAFTTWTLALAREEFGIDRDVATLDAGAQTFELDADDGVPDIVQQVQWGALWLLSMEQEDGLVYNGVCANNQQRSGRPLGELQDQVPGTADDRQVYVDYHSDCGLAQTIALAAASRVLADSEPGLADRCLQGARRAFDYYMAHPDVFRSGSYAAGRPRGREGDAMAMAAAIELYLTTGEQRYLSSVTDLADCLDDLQYDWPFPRETGNGGFWYAPPFLARLWLSLPDGELRQALEGACRRAAETKARHTGIRPWPFDWYHFGEWGNTPTCTSRAFDTYWLSQVAPDVLPPRLVLRNMLWVFGLHPTCDTVFVCGLAYPGPRYLYSSDLTARYGMGPSVIPGAVVPGMGGFWHSGVVRYIDEHGYYGSNEACIYTQAQYIFAVNAMKAMGF